MITTKALAEKIGLEKNSGFWGIKNRYFFDKFECLRYASSIKEYDVKFYFYDSVYRTLDWSKEPIQSLDEMYKDRAQQLRDEYDYLILSFSGGSDCNNILRTFIDNNIKLDEVYCEYPIETLDKLKSQFHNNMHNPEFINMEWFTAAEPLLKKLSISNPEIKITIDSDVKSIIEVIESNELYKLKRGGSINPVNRYRSLYKIAEERTKYGSVVCINGSDKPSIYYNTITKQFYNLYTDVVSSNTQFLHDTFSETRISLENFYLTYKYPQLNQKMAFAIKNKIVELIENKDVIYNSLLWGRESKDFSSKLEHIHTYNAHTDLLKKVLYKTYDTSLWQAGKFSNFSHFYFGGCNWFYDRDITTERTREFYDKQILELIHDIDYYFLSYQNNKPSKLKIFYTEKIPF
tara:strand:+ start:132 stop:1343 length:1212 start_codon:yes stop_codon:yes gene_type:complete